MEDFRAAVRFVRSKAEEYRFDTDKIIATGGSAGASAALFLAYAQEAQYEGDSGNPGFSSQVHGVVSLAGALKD